MMWCGGIPLLFVTWQAWVSLELHSISLKSTCSYGTLVSYEYVTNVSYHFAFFLSLFGRLGFPSLFVSWMYEQHSWKMAICRSEAELVEVTFNKFTNHIHMIHWYLINMLPMYHIKFSFIACPNLGSYSVVMEPF